MQSFSLQLSRHAFSPRDVARAGDIWRAFQDVAVLASSELGWPPERYRIERCAFVVRSMRVHHVRELRFGETLVAQTWIARVRREMFFTREIRLATAGGDAIAAASQEWVHVGESLSPSRARQSLLSAIVPESYAQDEVAEMPAAQSSASAWVDALASPFEFDPFYVTMDPLGHANHPAYIDWCDEAVSRALAREGRDPHALVPVAEEAMFRTAAQAGVRVRVETAPKLHDGAMLFEHSVRTVSGVSATVRSVRALVDEPW